VSLSKHVRIYPKEGHESEAQLFLESYDEIQLYIKLHSLSMHLDDADNALIPTIEKSNQDTESLEKSVTEKLYRELRSTRLLDFRKKFSFTEPWKYYPSMYRFLQIRMPNEVMVNILDGHQDTRKLMVAWNTVHKKKPCKELLLTDERVEDYILSQFGIAYQHFCIPLNQTTEIYEQINFQMHQIMAQSGPIEKLKEDAQHKMSKKITEHQRAINALNHLFTTVLGDIPTDVRQLVDNRQYTKAYNLYLHFHLVVKDRSHVIIKLERNMLDLSYDTTLDTSYAAFMDRFTYTHALYLFVQWHTHFTIDDLKLIIAGTEREFSTKHAAIIATHDLSLPSKLSHQVIS